MGIFTGDRISHFYMEIGLSIMFHAFPGREGMVIRIIDFVKFKRTVLY